jgi:hypothetical protein
MEGSSAIVIAILVLAGGGATGAVLMTDGGLLDDNGPDRVQQVQPLPYGNVDGSCSLGRSEGDCVTVECSTPAADDDSGGGCC